MAQGLLEVSFLPRATTSVRGMFDLGVLAMTETLKGHPNLEKIGFNNNKLGPESAKALAYVLRAEGRHPTTRRSTRSVAAFVASLSRSRPPIARLFLQSLALVHALRNALLAQDTLPAQQDQKFVPDAQSPRPRGS